MTLNTHRWWRDAVIYQVYVRSFLDSTDDGIGDLAGVRAGMPYLKKLGVDGIWLSPFYPSPQHDHGYDVADDRDVDPLFGDLAEFDLLMTDARRLGIKVLLDIVPNHCSSEHPLFRAALAAEPGSAARARFHFADGRGRTAPSRPTTRHAMFGDRPGPASPRRTATPASWYLHMFHSQQPDLNWRNPEVGAHFDHVLRLLAPPGRRRLPHRRRRRPLQAPRPAGLARPAGHAHPRLGQPARLVARGARRVAPLAVRLRGVHRARRPRPAAGRRGLGSQMAREHAQYVRPDELHQAFFFDLLSAPWNADAFRKVISEAMQDIAGTGSTVTWVLNNHDQVRTVTRYGELGTEGSGLGTARARAAALLMLALPGAAYIYQGEELGLPEVVDLPDDVLIYPNPLRCTAAAPVSATAAGFAALVRTRLAVRLHLSGAESAKPWLPQPAYFAEHAPTARSPTPAPSGTCTATGSSCAPDFRSWRGRAALAAGAARRPRLRPRRRPGCWRRQLRYGPHTRAGLRHPLAVQRPLSGRRAARPRRPGGSATARIPDRPLLRSPFLWFPSIPLP